MNGITTQSMLSSLSCAKLFTLTIDKTSIHSLRITVGSSSPNSNILIIIYPSGDINNDINNGPGNIIQIMYITLQDGVII